MGMPKIEALKWALAFGRGFGAATAPYYGVNTFDVRPEFLKAVVANVDVQSTLARTIGAEPESWSERDNGGLVRVAWVMSYPSGINSRGSGPPRAGSLLDRILGYRTFPNTQLQWPILRHRASV